MRIMFVYFVFPVFVFYVKKLRKFAGRSCGPIIVIRKSHKEDKGLLVHELTHSRQLYRSFGLWWALYLFKKKRHAYEVEAYAEQLRVSTNTRRDIPVFARYLSEWYSTGVSRIEAEIDLTREYHANHSR